MTDEIAELLRAHQPTDESTWANHRKCICGESYHTMIPGRDFHTHVAEELLKKFALQLHI